MRYLIICLCLATHVSLTLANPVSDQLNTTDRHLLIAKTKQPRINFKAITTEIFEHLTPIFSGVASVQVSGKEVFYKVAGQADVRDHTPIQKNTRFPICSLSKQFTSVAVLRLVEQGKVNIDDPLHTYIKGMTSIHKDGEVCTVRHAMNHLCGFDRNFTHINVYNHLNDSEVRINYVSTMNEVELINRPGSKRLYSNVGYDALGIMVQDVTGQAFETFLKNEFFKPLGMTNTGIETPLDTPASKHARGLLWMKWFNLDVASTLILPSNFASTLGASGNIYSTVNDLHIWNNALHMGHILQPETYHQLLNIPEVNKRTNTEGSKSIGGYAGGLIVGTYEKNNLKVIWHNGALVPYNFSSFMGWAPQSQTSLVMLSNHAIFVSKMTKTGLHVLEWQHGLLNEVSSPKLSWLAYLFLIIFTLIFCGLPLILYLYIRLFIKGHHKGHTKAFSSLLSYTIYIPFLLLMVWGGPVRGPLIFSVFILASVVGLIKRFQFFHNALHDLRKMQYLKLFVPHLVVTMIMGSMDLLGALLILAGLTIVCLVYVVANHSYTRKS